MPSSTSSSNERLPDGPWLRTWLVTIVLAVVVLTAAETFWRRLGYTPTLIDDLDLWATQRSRVETGSGSIVLIGSSRNQAGLATEELSREFPKRTVVQLSVTGGHPMAVLRDLANDEKFSGLVICDVLPQCLLSEYADTQQQYVRHYHEAFNLARRIERTLKTAVQRSLTIDSAQLKPIFTIHALVTRKLPVKSFFFLQPDRSRRMDFRAVDSKKMMHGLAESLRPNFAATEWPNAENWNRDIERVRLLVARIQKRGGNVVFVRQPSSGEVRSLEDRCFPRATYWDVFAKNVGAETIHCDDLPGLAERVCPDGSHLAYQDAVLATKAIIDELRRRHVVE